MMAIVGPTPQYRNESNHCVDPGQTNRDTPTLILSHSLTLRTISLLALILVKQCTIRAQVWTYTAVTSRFARGRWFWTVL